MMIDDYTFRAMVGLDFKPSPRLRKVPGLTWANNEMHWWWSAHYEEEMVACVGLALVHGQARFKTDATIPEHRGKGLYRHLNSMREKLALSLGCTKWTCFSTADSRPQFLKQGFKIAGEESPRGVVYMVKEIPPQPRVWMTT